ncbi:Protein bric-a-brac-like protein [Leptotrombidium deliense]|uniref:Protein bric-a-brac-like protein n=1 Tax=Leptotrombidium deliense TaxID=299467 RepID=A0A443SNW8_9ACAR|nr:Protein bric-a-brac-like protein [Leptotrombidium deliense]
MSMLSSPMANSQQFCLKWNNHSANLTKTLTEMVADECFVDVTLACEGTFLKAHKMVLSACSNYFKELFKANPCQHPIVILKDMKIDDLKAIIDFMYKGEVNVSQNQLGALLKTAEVLKVKGLTEVGDDSEKIAEKRGAGHLEETGDHATSCNQTSTVNASGRKKKKRRTKKPNQQTSSPDDGSGTESGHSSEEEETVDMTAVKRVKESNHGSTSQPQHSQSIPESLSNVMQTRRRTQQMPQLQQPLTAVFDDTCNDITLTESATSAIFV